MPFHKILPEKNIVLGVTATDKRSALAKVSLMLAERTGLYDKVIRRGLLARERLGSTGFGSGIAIPHCFLDNLPHPVAFLTRLSRPVPYDALDHRPVDILFTILWPPRESMVSFLLALASACRAFHDEKRRHLIRHATSPAAVLAAFAHSDSRQMPDLSAETTNGGALALTGR